MKSVAQVTLVAYEEQATSVTWITLLGRLLMCSNFGTELDSAAHQHMAGSVVIPCWIISWVCLANVCGEGTLGLVSSKGEVVVLLGVVG